MAISMQTDTRGFLDIWRDLMNESIWHFNQAAGDAAPYHNGCEAYIQPERERLSRALVSAYNRMSARLGFNLTPIYTSEIVPLKAYVPYERQRLHTKSGYVQAYGQRATSLIEAGAAIVFSDEDGDGVDDTATITTATAVDADEIQIFFQVADGAPSAGHALWRIEPVTVTSTGAVATIVGHRALFVEPDDFWQIPFVLSDPNSLTRNVANTTLAADFVTAVDVYRVYTDTSVPCQIYSDPYLEGKTTGLDDFTKTTGIIQSVDNIIGSFRIRHPTSSCPEYPERVKVYYLAGMEFTYDRPDNELMEAMVRLANTFDPLELPAGLCERSRALWARDRETMPPEELQAGDVANPFGLKRGQVYAWRIIQERTLGVGGKL